MLQRPQPLRFPGFLLKAKLGDNICQMSSRIIILFLFISLLALAVADPLPRGSLSETQVLNQSRIFVEQHRYVSALRVLNMALVYHPRNEVILNEFRKDSELYFLHEISSGYHRIQKDIHDVKAYIRISNAFWKMGQRSKALEVLTDAILDNANSAVLWHAIGNLENKSGRLNEAASAFQEAAHL